MEQANINENRCDGVHKTNRVMTTINVCLIVLVHQYIHTDISIFHKGTPC